MIGKTIGHYKIREKPPSSTGQVGGGGSARPDLVGARRPVRRNPVGGGGTSF